MIRNRLDLSVGLNKKIIRHSYFVGCKVKRYPDRGCKIHLLREIGIVIELCDDSKYIIVNWGD